MVMKGMFLYVIRRCISPGVVTLRYREFSDWSTQSVSNSRMGHWFVMCDLSMQLA